MFKKTLLIAVFLLSFTFVSPAHANNEDDFDFKNIFKDFQEGVEEQSQDLEDGAEGIVLPTYQDDPFDEGDQGINGIVNTINTFLDFFKLLVTPIAIMVMVIMGMRMVAAGRENEEVWGQAKNYILYAAEGLFVIFMADVMVEVFFGAEGDVFRSESDAKEFGRQASGLFQGIYSLIQVIIASVSVFVLVTAGMRYVGGSFSDDQIAGAKRQITWSLVGLFVIGISEFVAKDILFPDEGSRLGLDSAKDLFAQVTNFIAGTIGTLAFAFMLYAGYLYVTARENDDQVSKAKKILTGAAIGIILAIAAFAITNTLVELDAAR